ncbi:helicase-related protein [Candidatus Poriferisodalis sp.]|uniref:helicase-related protein n=1 Tax=Candidatus Poriferisodalis sp. TaxID=3101277 RepID=UPI003B01FDFA
MKLSDLTSGMRLRGIVAGADVTVVAVGLHGAGAATLTYRRADGSLGERLVCAADLADVSEAAHSRWTFDADGAMFRLASEARRMQSAHLADPFAAVDTSSIEPYPHQIDAVYNRLLALKPLRFVLADDPGAGKTIMSGLLIRELMLRGDVARCLIVAPGSLVEQWQDELWDKFGLSFEMLSRDSVEASRTGNSFLDRNLLIARLDQMARSDELRGRLAASEWDLVIVDEAHKMSARRYGEELRATKRFRLGEVLRECTRHFLLLTATPHNGKLDDFLAFMTLIDPERFEGRSRAATGASASAAGEAPDVSDVMRRLVKENLRTFDGRRLFPQRFATTLQFDLSESEAELYEAVTSYVRDEMNRAARMTDAGDRRRGVIVGFALAALQRRLASSPAAIHRSLVRRRDRLAGQAAELRRLAASGEPIRVPDLPKGVRFADLEEFDIDNFSEAELEELDSLTVDAATAAATADELEAEVRVLDRLVTLAERVRNSRADAKWTCLRGLLRSDQFRSDRFSSDQFASAQSGLQPPRSAPTSSDRLGREADGRSSVRKLIVFTEHRDTLDYVADRIRGELGRADAVATIHGGMKRQERRAAQDRFRVDPSVSVLVATDAAGEGVNLQVANMMVNYDLPWNPNRIEQRFGRIHRIGQQRPCHLWNLVAHRTREGQVFERLFAKIEQQREVYGDQVYDVLGDAQINVSLRDVLLQAIQADSDPAHAAWMDTVIEAEIGVPLRKVLEERALLGGLVGTSTNDEVRRRMEEARARRLQPWFVHDFFAQALQLYGGRIVRRESGRYEITRVPASVREAADPSLGPVQERYARVTFDKAFVQPPEGVVASGPDPAGDRAELISPGTALLGAVARKVLDDHGYALHDGAVLVDSADLSVEPRLLVCLDHVVTDGRTVNGARQVVSRRCQYVEVDAAGHARDPGAEPYLDCVPLTDEQQERCARRLDTSWTGAAAETVARDWAIEHLAGPHLESVAAVVRDRVARVREAVRQRLMSEIHYWDRRAIEIGAQEAAGGTPKLNSENARRRAEELEGRLARRRTELDAEEDVHSSPPTVVAAAVIVPQGLLDHWAGAPQPPDAAADRAETDRRAVAAVLAAERALGRIPAEQEHANPGYDVMSVDPATGDHYFIEVKGHLPRTEQIHVSARQVRQAQNDPERWRLAVVSVPDDPAGEPQVRYLVEPFAGMTMHDAQPNVPLDVAKLLADARPPC